MKQIFHLINVMLVVVMMGCTKAGQEKSAVSSRVSAPKDTIHTREAAMDIYGYQRVAGRYVQGKNLWRHRDESPTRLTARPACWCLS